MNMKDIMIVCDVVMDPTFEIMAFVDIAIILLLFGVTLGVIVYVITRIVKLVKAMKIVKANSTTVSNIENAQTAQNASDIQKDDIEQLK